MTEAAIRADYADQKRVLTRKVLQIILEVPIEQHEHVNKIIGLPSLPGESKWVGVALLDPDVMEKNKVKVSKQKEIYAGKTEGEKAVARAVLMCKDRNFIDWMGDAAETSTVNHLKEDCGIASRSELAKGGLPLRLFLAIEQQFREETGQAAEQR